MSDQNNDDKNIVELPTRAQERFKWQSRLKDQRAVSVLSLGSVVMVCLLINQYLNLQQESMSSNKNREVASVRGSFDVEENVKWEQQMAQELNSKNVRMIQAVKPVEHDQLVFGELRGQYMAHLDADFKIRKLVLTGTGDEEIIDAQKFLTAKKDIWSVQFDRVEVDEQFNADATQDASSAHKTRMILYRGSEKVGLASIEKNPMGKLKSLEIQ